MALESKAGSRARSRDHQCFATYLSEVYLGVSVISTSLNPKYAPRPQVRLLPMSGKAGLEMGGSELASSRSV